MEMRGGCSDSVVTRFGRAAQGRAKRARAWYPLNRPAAVLMRRLARGSSSLRFWSTHLPVTGVVTVRLPCGRVMGLWSLGDDGVANAAFWHGPWATEPDTAPYFAEFARRASVVVDVGAHVGLYTLIAANLNPSGNVIALEPHAGVFARLERNVRLNGALNVQLVCAAAGGARGKKDFWRIRRGIPSSSSLSREFMETSLPATDLVCDRVDMVRLDDLLSNYPRVDLLKLDTESTEHDVLAGACQVLAHHRPVIFCEVLPSSQPAVLQSLLSPHEYGYFLLTDQGPVAMTEIVPDSFHRNYLFLPRDAGELLQQVVATVRNALP